MKSSAALIVVFVVFQEVFSSDTKSGSTTTSAKLNATRRSDDVRYPDGGSQTSGSYDIPKNQYASQGYGEAVIGYEPPSLVVGLRSVSADQFPHQLLGSNYNIHNTNQESQGSAVVYSDSPGEGNSGSHYGDGRYFNVDETESPQKNHVSIRKKYSKDGIYGGGWDVQSGFNSGGPWFGGGSSYQGGGLEGSGLSGAAGLLAVKKAVGAKALFVLILPLILLAVFGPILAGQAMLPWALAGAGAGLATVSSTATTGKRRRRSIPGHLPQNSNLDPRQVAELEKRLRVFMAVQEYIAQTGSEHSFQDDISAAYMKCQGYLEDNNQCMERVACEYADKKSGMNGIERKITGMVLQNIMTNSYLPAGIKGRLSKGGMFGRTHPSRCSVYFCDIVDGKRRRRPNPKTSIKRFQSA